MKKVLLVLLAMAAPVFASVTFTATDNNDGTCTISYTATAGDEPVGMGLVVDCTSGQIDAIASISSFFDIFLDFAHDDGSYTYGEGSSNKNNAAAKVGSAGVQAMPSSNFVISIGGLGGAALPLTAAPSSGSIVLNSAAPGAEGTISADSLRGGVVDKAGTVTTNLPISFTITAGCVCPGDVNGDAVKDFFDFDELLFALDNNDWYIDPSSPAWNACGDYNQDGVEDFFDFDELLFALDNNDWYIECP